MAVSRTFGFLMIFCLAFCSAARADVTIYWGSPNGLNGVASPDIRDHNNVPVPKTADWTISIHKVVDSSLVYMSTGAGSQEGEKWWATSVDGTFFWQLDVGTEALQAFNGVPVYTKIVDPSGWYANIGLSAGGVTISWAAGAESDPQQVVERDYNFGVVGSSDWQVVPEPSVMALFGLGLVTLVARRKMAAKA
jgi:hypothetical protein